MNRSMLPTSVFVLRNALARSMHTSAVNYAMPTKAKKKTDPLSDKIREDRKRRRFERVISKLEKFKLQLKPIHEYESERRILKELEYGCTYPQRAMTVDLSLSVFASVHPWN